MPLTAAPSSGENREFRVTVIPQTGAAQPFQTLEQAASEAAKHIPPNGKKNCEPRLSLQRDGGRVTNIRIQCTCGQTMDLACVYDEPPKT
ncbi:MAG TPA: hypothetical protein VGH42_00540 [Verrucomicrobiae bacterium]